MSVHLDDGDVVLHLRRGPFPVPIGERFWCKAAVREQGCWDWKAGRYPNGYGKISGRLAHRVAWEITRGAIPPGWLVLHRCGRKECVRPDHLYLGNKRQNLRDCKDAGQYRTPNPNPLRGERHPGAKLTARNASEIRAFYASGRSQSSIAALYGVSQPTVSLIVRGLRWV